MTRFGDKVVVITGASAGIGAAVARLFAGEGARLVLAARGVERLESFAVELRRQGVKAIAVPTDVADDRGCAALLEAADAEFGRVDIVVNNAGANTRGVVEKFSAAQLAAVVDINLRAPIVMCRLALPYLRRAGGGALINLASIAGRVPLSEAAVYSATKFGLRVFSFALAEELAGSGITVSAVSPGPVDTGFIMDQIDEVSDMVFSQPMSTAEEIAALVLACATDGKRERALPRASAYLATLGYLVPSLRRVLEPVLRARGRRAKERYRARATAANGQG